MKYDIYCYDIPEEMHGVKELIIVGKKKKIAKRICRKKNNDIRKLFGDIQEYCYYCVPQSTTREWESHGRVYPRVI